jgi:hypothetical protein
MRPSLWIVYTCKFRTRFRIKLARFYLKKIFKKNKCASLMRNRVRGFASVNTPLETFYWFRSKLECLSPSVTSTLASPARNLSLEKSLVRGYT